MHNFLGTFWILLVPCGRALHLSGYDVHHGFQLYHTDPSGNFSGWKARVSFMEHDGCP